METDHDVFQDCHPAEQFNVLKGSDHATPGQPFRRKLGNLFVGKKDLPRGLAIYSRYDIEERSFAGAIGTDDSLDFTLGNGKGNVPKRGDAAENG
jgi:hypothetical protein